MASNEQLDSRLALAQTGLAQQLSQEKLVLPDLQYLFGFGSFDEPQPFPVESFGPKLAPVIEAIHQYGIAHESTIASTLIGALSSHIAHHINVGWPIGKQSQSTCLWTLHLAESGSGKSTVADQLFSTLAEMDRLRERSYQRRLEKWQASDKETRGAPPQNTRRRIGDITIAALLRRLEASPVVAYLQDEGAVFTDGWDFGSSSRNLSAAANLSNLFSRGQVDYARASDRIDVSLSGRRVTLCVLTQPDSGLRWLKNKALNTQGVPARFLVSMAARRKDEGDMGSLAKVEETPEFIEMHQNFKLWEFRDLLFKDGDEEEEENKRSDKDINYAASTLEPKAALLQEDAALLLGKHHKNNRNFGRRKSETSIEAPFLFRVAEHTARLSALLAAYHMGHDELMADGIPIEFVRMAYSIVSWFRGERTRIYYGAHLIDEDREAMPEAEHVVEWLWDHSTMEVNTDTISTRAIGARDAMQRGPQALRAPKRRDELLGLLVEYGYVTETKVGRGNYWLLHPDIPNERR